ncbi:alpha/beta fold hydrolase [Micromonospora sp. CB01531]|uniref:alpha/beta fold hydrolase n=1 Tax=Micromonospora sp. CB01531 TaxID=1718947 RepID=UPI00093AC4B2|nr:alpha/beta fold hydrolase [Micromonospora sp. CB01531]OKI44023.1 hypothetical protein A6A27_38705 [Micromonospora sp. CB01531]
MKARHRRRPRISRARITALAVSAALLMIAAAGWSALAYSESAASATDTVGGKPPSVLVYAAWADSGSWDGVTERQQRSGHTVDVLPSPLRGLSSDAEYVRSFLCTVGGPVVLVGHPYGGAVITAAGTGNPNARSQAYVDAFAEAGGTVVQLALPSRARRALAAPTEGVSVLVLYPDAPAGDADPCIKQALLVSSFANDLPSREAAAAAAAHVRSVPVVRASWSPLGHTVLDVGTLFSFCQYQHSEAVTKLERLPAGGAHW